jgi:hypothetical protein
MIIQNKIIYIKKTKQNNLYLGGGNREDQFEASPGKKFVRPPSHPMAGCVVVCACHPSSVGIHK